MNMHWKNKLQFAKKLAIASLKETASNFRAVNLYAFGILKESHSGYPHPQHSVNPRPILLVHGIVHNRSAFHPLKARLERLGWHNIYTMNYQTHHGSLSRMVGDLSKRVDAILKETNAQQVDIVAHSLGGLVSRFYMTLGDGRGKVKELITLGTSHQGTQISNLLSMLPGNALSSDLRPDSYLLKILNDTALSKGSQLTSIASSFDWTVWPKNSCWVSGTPKSSYQNISIDSIGHTSLLYDEKVFQAIVATILHQPIPEESCASTENAATI